MNNNINPSCSFVGAWELISGSYIGEDQSVTNYEDAEIKSLKVLSESKFSFVTSAGGAFYAAGGGDYLTENGRYVEIPQLASHSSMLGQRYEFEYQLEGDIWTNSRWQGNVRVELEVWKRVG
jgi:hypothetical protein